MAAIDLAVSIASVMFVMIILATVTVSAVTVYVKYSR